jgi:hypothetical protein
VGTNGTPQAKGINQQDLDNKPFLLPTSETKLLFFRIKNQKIATTIKKISLFSSPTAR